MILQPRRGTTTKLGLPVEITEHGAQIFLVDRTMLSQVDVILLRKILVNEKASASASDRVCAVVATDIGTETIKMMVRCRAMFRRPSRDYRHPFLKCQWKMFKV